MRLPLLTVLAFITALLMAVGLAAQVINVDINNGTANNYTGLGIVPGDTGTTWNALGLTGTQVSVNISAGGVKDSADTTLAAVAITLASSDGTSGMKRFATTSGSVPSPTALMQDYAYGGTFNITVSGLTPGSYGLWFFGHGDVASQAGNVTVNAANGGGTGSTANSALGRDLLNGGPGVSYVSFTNLVVGTDALFRFQAANYFNGFQLRRVPGPAITAQPPATPSVVTGGNVTLSVTAVGDGALSYQWRKGSSPLTDGPSGTGSTYSGGSSTALTIQGAQPGDAGDYTVVVTSSGVSVISTVAALSVASPGSPPVFTTPPADQAIFVGAAATLSALVTGAAPLVYQWQKSTDGGVTFTDISGATSLTYALPVGRMSAAGRYRLVATNSVGSATSATATITVTPAYAPLTPDGFASTVTGGGNLTPVVVTTVAAFKALAEGTAPAVITLSGTFAVGNVRVKSNKTIQGIDADATIIGNVLLKDVSNVILRGLNFTNPGTIIGADGKYTDGGDGVSSDTSTGIFVTHCTFFDCADGMIDTRLGSTDVTLSWCKLYYTSATTPHHFTMIADGDVLRDPVTNVVNGVGVPLRMTFHHNWWADYCDQRMPSSTHGRIHMFNNYWNTPGNYYAALARSSTQFLSEQNRYVNVNNPLSKSITEVIFPDPLIRALGNSYASCTGSIDAGTDMVFTPTYSYPLNPAADVAALVLASAGNIAGAASTHPTPTTGTATINGPANVGLAAPVTLVATPTGFTPLTYQWRFKNIDLSGSTGPTLQITSAQLAQAGAYSVVLGQAGGEKVVSSGFDLAVLEPYAAYLANHGLDLATTGAPAADPDADGVANRLEFFLGRSPVAPDAPDTLPTLRVVTGGSPGVVFEFFRHRQAAAVSYAVEYTSDLSAPWTSAVAGVGGITIVTTPLDATSDRITVTLPATAPSTFLRLKL